MYIELTIDEALRIMKQTGRDNFSAKGLELIMSHLDECVEGEAGAEFDQIAIDCEWLELDLTDTKDRDTLKQDYRHLVKEGEKFEGDEDEVETLVKRLEEVTTVLVSDEDCLVFAYNF